MNGDEEDDFETADPARAQRRLKALQRHCTTPAANNKRKTPLSRTPSSTKRPATVPKARYVSRGQPASQQRPIKPSASAAVASVPQQQHPSQAAGREPSGTTIQLLAPQPQQLAACFPGAAAHQHLSDSDDDFQEEGAAPAPRHAALDGIHSMQLPAAAVFGTAAEASTGPEAAVPAAAATKEEEEAAGDSQQHSDINKAVSVNDEAGMDKCPMCLCCLADISVTEAGRAAHVNACLDAAAGATAQAGDRQQEQQDQQKQQWQGQQDQQQQEWQQQQQLEGEEQQQQEQQQDIDVVHIMDDDIAEWLASIGATDVLACFSEADIDLSVLPHLNDHDLQEMGVTDAALRQRILTAAARNVAGQSVQSDAGPSAAAAGSNSGIDMQQQWHQQHICWEQQQLQQPDLHQGPTRQPMQPQQLCCDSEQPPGQEHFDDDGWCYEDNYDDPAGAGADGVASWGDLAAEESAAADRPAASAAGKADGENQPGWNQWRQQQQQQAGVQQAQRQPLQSLQASESCNAHGCSAISMASRSAGSSDRQQGSIVGWLQPQQQGLQHKQQEQGGIVPHQQDEQQRAAQVKQQWRSLFNRPGRVLAPPQPLQQRQRLLNQQQIGREGRLQQPQQQQPQQPQQQQLGQVPVLSIPRGRTADLPSWWPAWRRLPGTNIIVDAFGQSSKALGLNRNWILTHFHADHYMGLTKGFKQGRIYCTPTTAALVKLKLRVPDGVLVPLQLGQEVVVEGTRLQLIDANHCPGAAMVVAHPPYGAPPVLHTGDARLTAAATQQQPALQALVGKAVLVLDTTYADPAYCFPPQQEVLDWVLRAVKAESFNPRCLFLFGSYTIGKERLFLHVAQALKRKVYVAAAKRAVMGCLSLPPEQAALLTTNHLEANIHVVPMRQVNLAAMESLLVRYKGRYTAVVGFQPTGWSHAGPGGGSNSSGGKVGDASRSSSSVRPSRRLQRGTVVLYKVPYSEHSSCAELREFVAWFKPLSIIPSVSNDNGAKMRQMLAAVTANSSRASGPMDAFARPNHRGHQQQQQLEPLEAEQGDEEHGWQ